MRKEMLESEIKFNSKELFQYINKLKESSLQNYEEDYQYGYVTGYNDVIKKQQEKINLNEWLSDKDIIELKTIFNFNVSDLKLKFKNLTLLIDEFLNLIDNNFNIVISECKKFNQVYRPSTIDLVMILKNYSQFRKQEVFNEQWYLKIIFKELFSNIDKIIVDYSLTKTIEKFIINEVQVMNYFCNEKLELFKMLVWEKKLNKWKIIILENINSKENTVSFKTFENKILKEIENDKVWVTLKIYRNKFEHSWADFFIKNVFNKMNTNFKYFIIYLIGLNIYLLENIWNIE
ncbi:hypothetical protein [Spiroplasma sp. AdecLV25b]|uniref:hypothetical protein n=1 Tax=Spiroplasma sp. AdecLV25b TaxID=3027162 RepID=UPI0027DF0DF2|nr:hypothetical protein [Spiroplasma sp. AdecLV25b]